MLSANPFNFEWFKMLFGKELTHSEPSKPRKHIQCTKTNDKIFDWSKMKAFVEGKINLTDKLKLALGWIENIVRIGENAGYQHFLLFLQCFLKF